MSLFQKSIEEKCLDELDPEPDNGHSKYAYLNLYFDLI